MSDAVFLLLGGGNEYVQFLRPLGDVIHIPGTPREDQLYLVKDVDAVVFTGGADVDPSLYGEAPHPRTSSYEARDVAEQMFYKEAAQQYVPCVGICRGAQFLTVMNNGRLYQHVTGHIAGAHLLEVVDPIDGIKKGTTVMRCSSTHHQMMNPYDLPKDEYVVCGWSHAKLSHEYQTYPKGSVVLEKVPEKEPEIVYFPYTDSLAIQGHPEFDDPSISAFTGMARKYINMLINRRLDSGDLGGDTGLDKDKLSNVSRHGNVNTIN